MVRGGCVPRMTRRGFNRAVTEALRLVESAEQQTGAPERLIVPAPMKNDGSRRLTLEKLLTLPQPIQRLAGLAELCQYPGGCCDRRWKHQDDVPGPPHADSMLDEGTCSRPIAFEEVEHAPGVIGQADGVNVMHGFCEPDRLSFVLGGFDKPAKLGETPDEPAAIEDRCGGRVSERLVHPFGGQSGEIVDAHLDHPLVLALKVVDLLERAHGMNVEA